MQTYFRLLADTARVLSETIDPAEALSDSLRLLVPILSDWCAVHHEDLQGRIVRSLVVFREESTGGSGTGLTRVDFEGPGSAKECLVYLESMGARVPRTVPLQAQGRSHGSFLYGDFGPGDFAEEEDLLAREFGRCIAYGLDAIAVRVELKAARDLLALSLDTLQDVVIAVDPDGRVRFLNLAAVSALGLADRAAAEGSALDGLAAGWSVFDEEGRPQAAGSWPFALALQGRQLPKTILRTQPPEGREQWWEVDAVPRFDGDGKVLLVLLHCRDISEERNLQAKVRRALMEVRNYRDLLQAALDALPDRLAVYDPSARMLYGNQAMAAFLNLGERGDRFASPLERPPDHLEITDFEGREVAWTDIPLARALRGETAQARVLRIRDLRTGAMEWADMRAVPIPTVRGDLALVVTTIHDVTALKRMSARGSEAAR